MLLKNYTDDKFIRAYNSFANKDSQFYLNEEEFYMYSILFTNQMMDGSIRTNVDIINQILYPIKFIKDDTKNKTKIRNLISSLINKKVLIVENDIKLTKNYSLIELTINDIELSNDGIDDDKKINNGYKNFAKIPFSKFLEFKSTRDYYIYFLVAKWGKGFKCSHSNWAELLGLKHRESAIRIIEDVVNRNIIYKNIGDYNTQDNQDVNVYSISPFNESEKTKQTKKVEQQQANDKIREELNASFQSDEYVKDLNDVIEIFQTYKDDYGNNIFPDDCDYAFYLEVKDNIKDRKPTPLEKKFIQIADKRMGYLKNNSQFQKEYENGERLFKEQQKEKLSNQLSNAINAIRLKTGDIVEVNKDNIDQFELDNVKSMFYSNGGHLQSEKEFVNFQYTNLRTNEIDDNPEMVKAAWESYQILVKEDVTINVEILNGRLVKMIDKKCGIVDPFSYEANIPTPEMSQEIMIDMFNEINEIDNDQSKKSSPIKYFEDVDIVF